MMRKKRSRVVSHLGWVTALLFLPAVLSGLLISNPLTAEDLNMDQLENISMTVGDLKEELKDSGHTFNTSSDTETIRRRPR